MPPNSNYSMKAFLSKALFFSNFLEFNSSVFIVRDNTLWFTALKYLLLKLNFLNSSNTNFIPVRTTAPFRGVSTNEKCPTWRRKGTFHLKVVCITSIASCT
jgi:hypothetical protein